MNREELAIKVLSILPTNIDNIVHCEKVGDRIILSDETTKYTIKIFSKRVPNDAEGCSTFLYLSEEGDPIYKPKAKYVLDKDAIHQAMKMNIRRDTIHKYVAYKCKNCGYWHVGKGKTLLSAHDKVKLKLKHNL